MKIKALLYAALLAMGSAQAANVTITHGENDMNNIAVTVPTHYIVIPVETGAPNARFEVTCAASNAITGIDIPLARTKVDHYVTINIEHCKMGDDAIKINSAPKDAIGWEKISFTSEYDPDKDEQYRPIYHHTPSHGWMNDPNGMFYKDGRYHLYYQHNPSGTTWGNMHWAHSSTTDFLTWKHEGIAITPDHLGAAFSGSCVVDENNLAGFGKDAVLCYYTSCGSKQVQSLAISTDDGKTFTKYEKNPILVSERADFRDPKVTYYPESKSYVMAIAAGRAIDFYSSTNLLDWTFASRFGEGYGEQSCAWECPDLRQVKHENGSTKWVLLVNNGGAPSGVTGTQYFIGEFDGTTFTCDDVPEITKWQDYGKDNYATVTWLHTPDNRAIAISWMSNWDYCNALPTVAFRSACTIPRELYLFDDKTQTFLGSRPLPELKEARTPSDHITPACEVCFSITPKDGKQEGTFKLTNDEGEELTFTIDFKTKQLRIDRRKSGKTVFKGGFDELICGPIRGEGYDFRLFIDKGSVECFVNDGRSVMTNIVFPSKPFNKLEVEEDKMEISPTQIYKIK